MNYTLFVHVVDSRKDLFDDLSSLDLAKIFALLDIVKKISTLAQLHY